MLQVKVHPCAKSNEITGFMGGVLQVKIAAPPEKGKANKGLPTFSANYWMLQNLQYLSLKARRAGVSLSAWKV